MFEIESTLLEQAQALYRDLHRHPEVGWHEHSTARRLVEYLARFDVQVSESPVDPGVVIDIEGGQPGRRVLLRADLDALPITEDTDLDFQSTVPGVMHACGHDLHMAMLATLAVEVQRHREWLAGHWRFVFQPSEEANPSGAEAMVAAGLADDMDAAMAMHVDPRLHVGRVAFREGVTNAAVDGIGITVRGDGGHAARPHLSADLTRVCALLTLELGDLVRRTVAAQDAAVFTLTTIQTGSRSNIIPDEAWMDGTLRTLDGRDRQRLLAAIQHTLDHLTQLHGATYELDVRVGQPTLVNDKKLSALTREVSNEVLGGDALHEMEAPSLGADDFSVFGDKCPIMMVRLGVKSDDDKSAEDLHSPRFVPDLAALPVGIRFFGTLADRVTRAGA